MEWPRLSQAGGRAEEVATCSIEAEGRAQAFGGLDLGRKASMDPLPCPVKGQLLKRQQKVLDVPNCVLASGLM